MTSKLDPASIPLKADTITIQYEGSNIAIQFHTNTNAILTIFNIKDFYCMTDSWRMQMTEWRIGGVGIRVKNVGWFKLDMGGCFGLPFHLETYFLFWYRSFPQLRFAQERWKYLSCLARLGSKVCILTEI